MDRYQEMERRFAACYQKHGKHSVRVLLEFYRDSITNFFSPLSLFPAETFPGPPFPLLIANVVNGVIEGGEAGAGQFY